MAAIATRADISVPVNVDGNSRTRGRGNRARWRRRTIASMERSVNCKNGARAWLAAHQWARIVASTSTKSRGARPRRANASVALWITTEIKKELHWKG